MNKKIDIKKISVTAILSAVAYLCMFLFRFKVSFLTFDFKDAVLAVISFLYGPLYGVFSSLVVALVEFVSVSDTGIYGLIMNFISSAAFSGVCGLFYKYRRTLSGAVLGSLIATLCMTAVMLVANIFITPFYMGVDRSVVIGMIPSLLLPFNLIKGIINAAITMIIYKPITGVFKKTGLAVSSPAKTDKRKFVLLAVLAAVVIALAVVVIVVVLNGSIEFVGKK